MTLFRRLTEYSFRMLLFIVSEIREAFELSDDEFKSRYGITKPVPRDLVVLHCLGGVRSRKALDILHEEGYLL